MENKKEIFEQFKAAAPEFDRLPDPVLWNRLEARLDKKNALKKVKFFRVTAYAAVFVILIVAAFSLNNILSNQNNIQFASTDILADYETEYLTFDYGKNFFNTESFALIRNAYSKVSSPPDDALNINGFYQAENGEIGFEIISEDSGYLLQFNFEGLPQFKLLKIEGNTLTFMSENEQSIVLNLEENGLSLTDSDFFHEYKGYHFEKLSGI